MAQTDAFQSGQNCDIQDGYFAKYCTTPEVRNVQFDERVLRRFLALRYSGCKTILSTDKLFVNFVPAGLTSLVR